MKMQELVRKINGYMMAGEIQQEFPARRSCFSKKKGRRAV